MTARFPAPDRSALSMSALLLGSVLAALPAEAQTFLPEPMERAALAFQLEKPFLPGSDGLDFYSSNLEVDAIVQLTSGRSVQIGLPLSIAGADGVDGTSFFVGNLRASLLFGEPRELSGFVGVTIPTASNIAGPDLAVVVLALPWLHVPEKWGDDVFSVRGAWIPSRPLEGGGRIGLRLGGATLVPDGFDNLHVFARAAGWGRVPVGKAELIADLESTYAVNSDDGFGEQFTAYLAVGVHLSASSDGPTLFIRVPLDGDANDFLDLSAGVSVLF